MKHFSKFPSSKCMFPMRSNSLLDLMYRLIGILSSTDTALDKFTSARMRKSGGCTSGTSLKQLPLFSKDMTANEYTTFNNNPMDHRILNITESRCVEYFWRLQSTIFVVVVVTGNLSKEHAHNTDCRRLFRS